MNPLKQGLKPEKGNYVSAVIRPVKEVNPLKQGLKLCKKSYSKMSKIEKVKEVNPLKQGLKQ